MSIQLCASIDNTVFESYAPEEYEDRFRRSRVFVKLYQTDYVSRSEARRVVSGLDEFREIVFDFRGVTFIGQAFSDEIFRVYRSTHPEKKLVVANENRAIRHMLDHVMIDN